MSPPHLRQPFYDGADALHYYLISITVTFKSFFRRLHLCLALLVGGFFIISGLSGSLLVWHHEIDAWLNPGLLTVSPANHAIPLYRDPAAVQVLIQNLQTQSRHGKLRMLELPQHTNQPVIAWYRGNDQKSSSASAEKTRQIMLDPANGKILGERTWGETGFSRTLLMPTLFHLHRNLLAGDNGRLLLSLSAVGVLLLSISGLAVWWPALRIAAWRQALTTGRFSSWRAFNFRLHRAAGFYLAPLFFLLALTGIYFNYPQWIIPVVTSIAPVSNNGKIVLNDFRGTHTLPLAELLRVAQNAFPQAHITRINFPDKPEMPFEIRLRQANEWRQGPGATRVSIDGYSGRILRIKDPLKMRGSDALFSTFYPLHSGEIFGFGSRLAISLTGLLPLLFGISGGLLWFRRRTKPKIVCHHGKAGTRNNWSCAAEKNGTARL